MPRKRTRRARYVPRFLTNPFHTEPGLVIRREAPIVIHVKHHQPEQRNRITMRQRITIIIGIAALALVAASAPLAATLTATATGAGAGGISLSHGASASLSSTLDGTDQTVTYAPVLNVVDATGTGNGW